MAESLVEHALKYEKLGWFVLPIVCLQKVLDKWGIKIGEGFRFPNTFYLSIKQPLKCNYTSFAEALCFS